ncbi:hypothetical protein ANO11243_044710 [Dothideomycetidae sp. 11243]|nr:hypothetical protein ANO11243_044710 [fungal sp. No.11243]
MGDLRYRTFYSTVLLPTLLCLSSMGCSFSIVGLRELTGSVLPGRVDQQTCAVVQADVGDTCASLAAQFSIKPSDFETWNPQIGPGCSKGIVAGQQYCVQATIVPASSTAPPGPSSTTFVTVTTSTSTIDDFAFDDGHSPTQPGLASDCNRFYQVSAGDTCANVQAKYNTFTLQQFYSWNPAVGNDCASLWAGYFVCIGVPGTPTAPISPPQPTSNGPQPQQPGITARCNNFYLVQSGDFCQSIADKYHVSVQQFESWNPSVGNDCKSLWVGYYVCVGSN